MNPARIRIDGAAVCLLIAPLYASASGQPPLHQHERTMILTVSPRDDLPSDATVLHTFTRTNATLRSGDTLIYQIFMMNDMPPDRAGLAIRFTDQTILDLGRIEEPVPAKLEGEAASEKFGQWRLRAVALNEFAGKTVKALSIRIDQPADGVDFVLVRDVRLMRPKRDHISISMEGEHDVDYPDGDFLPVGNTVLGVIPRAGIENGKQLTNELLARVDRHRFNLLHTQLIDDAGIAGQVARAASRTDLAEELDALADAEPPESFTGNFEQYRKLIEGRRAKLAKLTAQLPELSVLRFAVSDWKRATAPTLPDARRRLVESNVQAVKAMERDDNATIVFGSVSDLAALERMDPQSFDRIVKFGRKGRCSTGMTWAEPLSPIIRGESLMRHLTTANRFVESRFGPSDPVYWSAHATEHAASLPQLLRDAGARGGYLAYGQPELSFYAWEGIDGTQLVTVNQSAMPGWYDSRLARPSIRTIAEWFSATGSPSIFHAYEPGQILPRQPDEPPADLKLAVRDSLPAAFFEQSRAGDTALPQHAGAVSWGHDGTYSTYSTIKRMNHEAQVELQRAEALEAVAMIAGYRNPGTELQDAWRDVCAGQDWFTLGGSLDAREYAPVESRITAAIAQARYIGDTALRHIANRVAPREVEGERVLVANTLGWPRSGIATMPLPRETESNSRFRVTRSDGEEVQWQLGHSSSGPELLFEVRSVPGFGYDTYSIETLDASERSRPLDAATDRVHCRAEDDFIHLENGILQVTLDKTTGHLADVVDKRSKRDVLSQLQHGNVVELRPEQPGGRSRERLGPLGRPFTFDELSDLAITTTGPLRGEIRIVRHQHDTDVIQTIALNAGEPRIEMSVKLTWDQAIAPGDNAPLFGVRFPLVAPETGLVQRNIPFGAEVVEADLIEKSLLSWVSFTSTDSGAAILSKWSHGFRPSPAGHVSLTLMRTVNEGIDALRPLPRSFEYALAPAAPQTSPADLTRAAMEFAQPFDVVRLPAGPGASVSEGELLPPRYSAVRFDNAGGTIPSGLMPSGDGDGLVLRLYEASGEGAEPAISYYFPVTDVQEVDPIERPRNQQQLPGTKQRITPAFGPWQIRSILVKPGKLAQAKDES